MIGVYGPIFFTPGNPVTTFDNMKKTVTARWGEHEVWLGMPLLEYAGPKLIEVSFTMELIKPFTMDPMGAVTILEGMMDSATPAPLIVGMKPMGRGMSMFVMTSLSSQPKFFYRGGEWMGCSVEVQLKEYPSTSSPNNLMQALGGAFSGITGAISGVTGAVSGISGAIGAVTGALGGPVSSVIGALPSISGAIGSVTGAVSGITGAISGVSNIMSGALPTGLINSDIAANLASATKVVPQISQNAVKLIPSNVAIASRA